MVARSLRLWGCGHGRDTVAADNFEGAVSPALATSGTTTFDLCAAMGMDAWMESPDSNISTTCWTDLLDILRRREGGVDWGATCHSSPAFGLLLDYRRQLWAVWLLPIPVPSDSPAWTGANPAPLFGSPAIVGFGDGDGAIDLLEQFLRAFFRPTSIEIPLVREFGNSSVAYSNQFTVSWMRTPPAV
jgi:hypothetical protein